MHRAAGWRSSSERPPPHGTDGRGRPRPKETPMTPILDPRNGDIEDDAASTKRRSMLSLMGSLLAEISLPKLAIAWMLLDRLSRPAARSGAASGLDLDRFGRGPRSRTSSRNPAGAAAAAAGGDWLVRGPATAAACREQLLVAERLGCPTRLYRVSRRHFGILPNGCLRRGCSDDRRALVRAGTAAVSGLAMCGLGVRRGRPGVARFALGRQPGGSSRRCTGWRPS